MKTIFGLSESLHFVLLQSKFMPFLNAVQVKISSSYFELSAVLPEPGLNLLRPNLQANASSASDKAPFELLVKPLSVLSSGTNKEEEVERQVGGSRTSVAKVETVRAMPVNKPRNVRPQTAGLMFGLA